MTPILKLNKTLHLGLIDEDSFADFQKNRNGYFKKYHQRFWSSFNNQTRRRIQFRGEGLNEWVEPKSNPGKDIKALQTFLRDHGFMPDGRIDGIFGYWTLSSVRLFQEYIRSVEGKTEIGIPDGRVGNGTHQHMMRWLKDKKYCEWAPKESVDPANQLQPSSSAREYDLWMNLLPRIQSGYLQALRDTNDPSDQLELFQLQEVQKFPNETDSIKIDNWSFKRDDIHLIGLRCFQERREWARGNDDLFILLMNGLVFKFWGSTDPKPEHTSDGFEPYLVEGQHKYQFSWHKRSISSVHKVYKALVPYDKGVLVFRDWSKTDALDEEDIRKGLLFNKYGAKNRENPNTTINIHWTFDGRNNWSAGCQVISGRSYINHLGDLIDCSAFSAPSYGTVSPVSTKGVRKNRGAYTFISDFIYAYSRPDQDYLLYTLGRDGALEEYADQELLGLLKKQIPNRRFDSAQLSGEAIVHGMVSGMKGLV